MVGWMNGFDVACNIREPVDMAWDMARSTAELVGANVESFMTSRLVSEADVEPPMTIE